MKAKHVNKYIHKKTIFSFQFSREYILISLLLTLQTHLDKLTRLNCLTFFWYSNISCFCACYEV